MINKICFYVLWFWTPLVYGGGENKIVGAASYAMGGVFSTIQNVFSAHNNPAGLAYLLQPSVGLFANKPYALSEINHFNLSLALPKEKIGSFGLDINFFGVPSYQEMQAGLAFAKKLGHQVSLGLKLDYLRFAIQNHGAKNTFAFGLGLQYKPLKALRIAIHVYNPIALPLDKGINERLASSFTIGLAYLVSEKFSLHVESEKEISEKNRFKAGFEYKPLKLLVLRLGAAINPSVFTFGIGTEFKKFQLNVASSYHLQLGFNPQISIIYRFNKKDDLE